MREYRINGHIVRVHGEPNLERIKEATAKFLREVEEAKAAKQNEKN